MIHLWRVFFHNFTFFSLTSSFQADLFCPLGGGGLRSHPTHPPPCVRACTLPFSCFRLSTLSRMYGRSSSLSFSKDGRDILKFSFHSSGTTVCETKLSHHALVSPGRIQNLLALASRVFEPNRRYQVLEKAIFRIRIVLLLWETNKRLKRARSNSKQAIKNRSIFCSVMFVLIFGFGARACYSTTWYSDVIVSIFIRI